MFVDLYQSSRYDQTMTRKTNAECEVTEQRVFPRVPCTVDLSLRADVNEHSVDAVNLSLAGVGVAFKAPLNPFSFAVGSPVQVGMPGLSSLEALVTWTRGQHVGLRFCGQFPEILNSWVGEVLACQGVLVRDITRVA
jgi:PilZ domain